MGVNILRLSVLLSILPATCCYRAQIGMRDTPFWYTATMLGDQTSSMLPQTMRVDPEVARISFRPNDMVGQSLIYMSVHPYGEFNQHVRQCQDFMCHRSFVCVAPMGQPRCIPISMIAINPGRSRSQKVKDDGMVMPQEWDFSPSETVSISEKYEELMAEQNNESSRPSSMEDKLLAIDDIFMDDFSDRFSDDLF